MSTCDTCKWWGCDYDSTGAVKSFCRAPKMWDGADDSKPTHGCVVTDIGNVTFECGPKFGCVHHEGAD